MAVINALALSACASTPAPVSAGTADPQPAVAAAPAAEPATPRVETGNGERNRIETSGVTRNGRIFTIPEVTLEHNGWLVLHPFRDGRPVGEIYAGATYLPGGTHQNVAVTAQTVPMPEPGTMFIVMLHSDVNNDETFDFVFVDERNVADKAVFEGGKMIGHAIAAP
ncbi:MAG: hypothetical protein AAGI15_04565 [Pseudomonadota bacterium]